MMAVWEVEKGILIEHDKQAAIELRTKREAEEAKIMGKRLKTGFEPLK